MSRGGQKFSAMCQVLREPTLTPATKVLWCLYRDMDRGHGAWPGDEAVASMMGVSERSVRRYRVELTDAGYLRSEPRGPRSATFWPELPPVGVKSPDRADRSSDQEHRTDAAGQSPQSEDTSDRASAANSGRAREKDRTTGRTAGRTNLATPHTPHKEEQGEQGKQGSEYSEPLEEGERQFGDGHSHRSDPETPSKPPEEPRQFQSQEFAKLVQEQLWLGKAPPQRAPEGWKLGADLRNLKSWYVNFGADETEALIRGARILAERGELDGIGPGAGFTTAYLACREHADDSFLIEAAGAYWKALELREVQPREPTSALEEAAEEVLRALG